MRAFAEKILCFDSDLQYVKTRKPTWNHNHKSKEPAEPAHNALILYGSGSALEVCSAT